MAMDRQTLIRMVREAGDFEGVQAVAHVAREGGAGFPAHVKYDAQVETVIANGCECEPLMYSDQHTMARHAAEIVAALQAVMAAMGARRGIVAIKRKYAEIASRLEDALAGTGIELARLDNFYPAGDEQVLVHELLGCTIPPLGLPRDVGAVVSNVGTLYSVSRALNGQPVTHRVVTVTGEVARPSVLTVPVGTAASECIERCGGPTVPEPVYVLGGPMMGRFVDDPEDMRRAVITKTTGGLIVLPAGHYLHRMAALSVNAMEKQAAAACIQCRYCTDLCPRHNIGHAFETHRVMRAFGGGVDTAAGTTQAFMCSECGVCELFACPMRLSPRRINAMFKARFKQEGLAYEGPREIVEAQSILNSFRKVPVSRLAIKLDILKYMDRLPEDGGELTPASVRIPLQQHTGAPAAATVKAGDRVAPGALIGEIPAGALGARVHASIGGEVTEAGAAVSIRGN
jgi:Na+-translocating ferredoxin:NAD+ oxidoreductase RnfC subunit